MCVSAVLVSHIAKIKMFRKIHKFQPHRTAPHSSFGCLFVWLVLPIVFVFRISFFSFGLLSKFVSPAFILNRLDTLGLVIDKQPRSKLVVIAVVVLIS